MRRIAVSVAQHLPALVASEGAEQTEVTAENRALLNHRVNDRNPSVPIPPTQPGAMAKDSMDDASRALR
jgi:hypothetical protein